MKASDTAEGACAIAKAPGLGDGATGRQIDGGAVGAEDDVEPLVELRSVEVGDLVAPEEEPRACVKAENARLPGNEQHRAVGAEAGVAWGETLARRVCPDSRPICGIDTVQGARRVHEYGRAVLGEGLNREGGGEEGGEGREARDERHRAGTNWEDGRVVLGDGGEDSARGRRGGRRRGTGEGEGEEEEEEEEVQNG